MKITEAIQWFKNTFHKPIQAAIEGTPFTLDLITAIACQETGYIWQPLVGKVEQPELLKLCVGDTIGAPKRDAFPRTRNELVHAKDGEKMFKIAREALEAVASYNKAYREEAKDPNEFCHGFGIFQYDLQFFLTDPEFFLQKQWYSFEACLNRFLKELKSKLKKVFPAGKAQLTLMEMAYVAIAYNRGSFDPSAGLRQGHRGSDGKYYGEDVYDFLRLVQKVSIDEAAVEEPTRRATVPPSPSTSQPAPSDKPAVHVAAAAALEEVAAKNLDIALADLGLPEHRELATEVQQRLIALGFLEPPADGRFGPISRHALEAFQKQLDWPDEIVALDRPLAMELLSSKDDRFFPIMFDDSLGSRIFRYMDKQSLWYSRIPGHINIVYLEGANADGNANDDRPNEFNDRRLVLTVEQGMPRILGNWEATTEPGKYWTEHPMNPRGAARIAFGQYKAWSVGVHHWSNPDLRHEALVQVGTIRVYRDRNKDYKRTGDNIDEGDGFAINQHWGYDNPRENLGRSSAGCLVGRTKSEHRIFMSLVKSDPRYESNHAYRFMTTVIAGDEFSAEMHS